MSKNSIFQVKSNDFWEFSNPRVALIMWIFAPKFLCKYRKNKNWKLLQFDNFWRQNSNYDRSQGIIITIFFFNFWYKYLNSQFRYFFWKLNFWTQFAIFWQREFTCSICNLCFTVYLGVYWIGLRCLRAVILGNLTDVLTYLRIVYTSASIRVSTISTTFITMVSIQIHTVWPRRLKLAMQP